MSRGMSKEQADTAAAVKEKMDARGVSSPLMLPRAELAEAHRIGYPQLADAEPKTVSAYVSANMGSPVFWAAMGFDSAEIKNFLGNEIIRNIQGENKIFPKDKEVYLASLKIASGLAFESKSRVTVQHDFGDKTVEELEHYVRFGCFPGENAIADAEFEDVPKKE